MLNGDESGKCCRIRHIVRLRKLLRRWRATASASAVAACLSSFTCRFSGEAVPADVPSGHVAVYVGSKSRRFVVRATHLNHPLFRRLLLEAEEEYGFSNSGPLAIPCEEALFEEVLRSLALAEPGPGWCVEFWPESRPLLLHGLSGKPAVC